MYSKILGKLSAGVTHRDAQGIARAVGQLVSNGDIMPGDKLPPIRSVAADLGVSTSTVAESWALMRNHRLIDTDRRRGTTIRELPRSGRSRYWRVPIAPGTLDLDLSTGTPDPELLPKLEPILRKIQSSVEPMSYLDPPVLAELEVELRTRWPYDAPSIAVFDGANDGLDRIVSHAVHLGDKVILEDPTYPLLIDLLEIAGAEILGVRLDSHGPRLDDLEQALAEEPTAMIIQTGAHNPTGTAITQDRASEIADLLRPTRTILIEDNHAGATAVAPGVSLGKYLPEQVYRVHSFSKTYGPDLRIAAMSGPSEGIKAIDDRRQLGSGWTSRILQRILLEMLQSDEVEAQVAGAARIYGERRDRLIDALRERGIRVGDSHGLNIWIPVEREQLSAIGLAAAGIGVAMGEPFRVDAPGNHLRITSANLRSGHERLADMIASTGKTEAAT